MRRQDGEAHFGYIVYSILYHGSKHCLRRYFTPQIIPQTLPKKVFGSIGIVYYNYSIILYV